MKINTRVRYGLRAILQIAEGYGGNPVSVKTIADTQEISPKYLEQLVAELRRAGLIVSRKGIRGGYSLSRSPKEITLLDIISVMDRKPELLDCVLDAELCERSPDCQMRRVWTMLNEKQCEFWQKFTLSELMKSAGEVGGSFVACKLEES